jgi:hypothetical protein
LFEIAPRRYNLLVVRLLLRLALLKKLRLVTQSAGCLQDGREDGPTVVGSQNRRNKEEHARQ